RRSVLGRTPGRPRRARARAPRGRAPRRGSRRARPDRARAAIPERAPGPPSRHLPPAAAGRRSRLRLRLPGRRAPSRRRGRPARERFETALLEGRTAALVEQDRAALFTEEIGNIPAGAEVVAELVIDQRLAWLDEGTWEWRFPTVVAPRYLGAEGRVADGERVT